jgi:arylsulfatase A-like enzyme
MKAIVVIPRGCPAGWLGAYGNEWVVTPNLDRLAAESVVFDRHISDCPEPVAACRAWLGREPGLLPALNARGVSTVIVRANHPDTDAPDWYYAGWGERFDARPQEEDESPLDALLRSLPALLDRIATAPEFLVWIEIDRLLPPWDVSPEVFRAYLEHESGGGQTTDEDEDEREAEDEPLEEPPATPDEVVTPWRDPPTGLVDSNDPDVRQWLALTFGSVMTVFDTELGRLFDQLRERGLDRSAAWVLTSDFGYPLGEHGQLGLFRPWLYEELVHLPFILRLPAAEQAARRVYGLTQPPDLPILLLELYGLAGPGTPGRLALAKGEVASIREAAITTLELGPAAERAIRTDEWAYLLPTRVPEGETREPQLFQKPDDRWEVNDLRARSVERADELEVLLKKPAS